MHEWGITESAIKEIIRQAKENGLKSIEKISLSIGEETDIQPDSFEFCFNLLSEDTIAKGAKLEIQKITGAGITIDSLEGE